MFRSSMRSSSGSSLFTSLSMLLILKIIKIFKNYYQSIVVTWQHMFSMHVMLTVWRRELESRHYRHTKHMLPHNHDVIIILFKFLNILIVFNISNINKGINKKLTEDELIED